MARRDALNFVTEVRFLLPQPKKGESMKQDGDNPMQLAKIVQEYVIARIDKNDYLADRIWAANPDLQDRMVVAMIEERMAIHGCDGAV